MGLHAVPIKPYGFENLTEIQREFRFQGYIEGAGHRGINLTQLKYVIQWCWIQCFNWRDQNPHAKGLLPAPTKDELKFQNIMKWLVGPGTLDKACAMLEMLTDQKQTPAWFVSHVWNGTVTNFLKCLETHYKTRDVGFWNPDVPYWVGAFAVRMHDHAEDFRVCLDKCGFIQAINLCKGMLLILGDTDDLSPFTRTWCALELAVASDVGQKRGTFMLLDIAIQQDSRTEFVTTGMLDKETALEEQKPGSGTWAKECREKAFPLDILCKGLSIKLQKAEVTPPEPEPEEELARPEGYDNLEEWEKGGGAGIVVKAGKEIEEYRAQILNYVADRVDSKVINTPALSEHESYTDFNRKLCAEFALVAWPKALLQAPGLVEELGLPAVLAADTKRQVLVLDYFGCEEMGDVELVSLARGLPPGLSKLELSFVRCINIGNRGVVAVGKALPSGLRTLFLDFSQCGQINDSSLKSLALKMPSGLESLRLRFKGGKGKITNVGVEALSNALPSSLHTLELDFATCLEVGQQGIEALSQKLPLALHTLHLDFWMCGAIHNDGGEHGLLGGIHMLSEYLPETLSTLQLRFTGIHGNFSDKGVQRLSNKLPQGLEVLKLDLIYLDRLGDTGLEALGRNLPETLKAFELKVEGCDMITDAGVTSICDKMPLLNLHTLLLHFEFCGQITSKGVGELAEKLPASLRSLSLNFGSCKEIKDDGLMMLAEKLPSSLQKLHLDLKYCKKVGDMTMAALGKNLSRCESLTELSLHFGDCELIYDAGVVALAKGLPQAIEWLELNLWRCRNVGDTGIMYIAQCFPPSCRSLLLTIDGTKVSAEKRIYCTGIEAMKRCKPTKEELMAPMFQPDTRINSQCQIAFLRRHGPNLKGLDEALARELPVMEPVCGSLLNKLGSMSSSSFAKAASGSTMSRSASSPSFIRKKPPVAGMKYMSRSPT